MNRKLLLFTILFVCESLINSAYDDCSAFTCSKLKVETGEKCYLTGSKCQVHNDDCTKLTTQADCESNILFKELKSKCSWDTTCKKADRKCADYSPVSSLGVVCKELKTTDDTSKICVLNGNTCKEELKSEYGCSSTENEANCKAQIPIDGNNKIEPLKKCVLKGTTCSSELKECEDHTELDDCVSLLTSDNTKKKCFLEEQADNSLKCKEKNIKCEGYNDDVKNENDRLSEDCAAIIPYIDNSNIDVDSKCELIDKKCKTVKKKCEEISNPITCINHKLDDDKKRCVYKSGCIEQFKTCALYDAQTTGKDNTGCEAIEEDSSHKCVFTSSSKCENTLKKCVDYNSDSTSCNLISLNNTHKCAYVGSECIEQYKTCNLYTENDRIKCETIIPPEENMRCILKEDSKCESVPRDCEEHTEDNEYECINNYKPLDENYICVFNNAKESGKKCEKRLKYEYEYCSYYSGTDETICSSIIPKNKGEKYSIKCKIEDNKCQRIEKPCSDGNTAQECSLIIPKNSKKMCIFKKTSETTSECIEDYKTCEDFNNDKDDKETNPTNLEAKCKGIISIDGKKCKYTAPTGTETRGTCSGEDKSCSGFDSDEFGNACISIPLNDITKKCVYESGDCKLETKSCSELVFNGNESGIEEKCNKAKVSDKNNVCISSSDKKSCIEVDKSIAPASPTTKPNGGSQNNEKSGSNAGTNKGQEQETDNNFGKEIYLNKLLIIILCLLF